MDFNSLLNVIGKGDNVFGSIKGIINTPDYLSDLGVDSESDPIPIHYTYKNDIVTITNPFDSSIQYSTGSVNNRITLSTPITSTNTIPFKHVNIGQESGPLLNSNGVDIRQPTGAVYVYPSEFKEIELEYEVDSFGNIIDREGRKFKMQSYYYDPNNTNNWPDTTSIKSVQRIPLPKQCALIILGQRLDTGANGLWNLVIGFLSLLGTNNTYYSSPHLVYSTLYSKTNGAYFYDETIFEFLKTSQLTSVGSDFEPGFIDSNNKTYICFFRNEVDESKSDRWSSNLLHPPYKNSDPVKSALDAMSIEQQIIDFDLSSYFSASPYLVPFVDYVIIGKDNNKTAKAYGKWASGLWLSMVPDGNDDVDDEGNLKYVPIYHFYLIDNEGTVKRTNIIITQNGLTHLNQLYSDKLNQQSNM